MNSDWESVAPFGRLAFPAGYAERYPIITVITIGATKGGGCDPGKD